MTQHPDRRASDGIHSVLAGILALGLMVLPVGHAPAATAAATATATTARFSAEDLPRIVRLADPQVSPDGRSVLLLVSRANLKDDRYDAELVLVDVESRQMRSLTRDRAGVSSPRWSPQGDRIAFLAEDATRRTQLYVMSMNGGDPAQLTHSRTGVSLPSWRPDGRALAYAAADEEPERKDEGRFDDAFEVGDNSYLERSRPQPVHLWTVDAAGGEPRRITGGPRSLPRSLAPAGAPSQLVWTADGQRIVFVQAATPLTGDADSARLVQVELATGVVQPVAPAAAPQVHPLRSPDGKRLAYLYARDGRRGSPTAAWLASLGTNAASPVQPASLDLDRDVDLIGWTPDSRALLLSGNEETHAGLWLQTIDGGVRALSLPGLNPSAASIGPTGAVAMIAGTADHPAELYLLSSPDARPVQLTHLQTVTDGVALGRQETVHWTSDGFDVNGVLTYPPDYKPGRRLPLVLYIHGGPVSTSLQTFTPSSQLLAAQGWLVFEPNYRGSNNSGAAFQTAIHNHASSAPGRDIIAGVETLKARGIVDERRIAVSGWSYGGQMTSWLLGAYPDAWRAGIAGAPVTDLVDQYTLSDNNVLRAAAYGPSPFVGDNLRSYLAESPISQAWRVKAPTLILSDVGDWRVTTTQAYKFYHALKDNGVQVSFFAYPVAGHSPADPIRSRDVWRRWVRWLKPLLADEVPPAK